MRTQLAEYRVPARNPSGHSANKIHDDLVARQLGFRGGLVPGVTVYAYMTRPLVAAWGREWVEGGTASVRFVKPVYAGEVVTVRAAGVPADPAALEVSAVNPAGEPCAVLTARLPELGAAPSVDLAAYPARELPAEIQGQPVGGIRLLHRAAPEHSDERALHDSSGEIWPLRRAAARH